MSWNEQGEITKIEGILTIAFLVVSSCSHIDTKKKLYCIIKIPYSVSMPVVKDEEYNIIYREWVDVLPELKQKIKKLESENNELKSKLESLTKINLIYETKIKELEKKINQILEQNEKQKKEIITLKKHNTLFSELLDERKSGWIIRRDLAIRTNPVPNEPNEFGFPIDFDEGKVHKLHSNKEKSTWCKFRYYPDENDKINFEEYDMPWSLYDFLSGRIPINITGKKQDIKKMKTPLAPPQLLLVIKSLDEFKKHLESHDICPDSITKLDDVYKFLDENGERTFSRKRFSQFCDISSKTVTTYLNYLIESNLIFQIPGKTKYKVNIKET